MPLTSTPMSFTPSRKVCLVFMIPSISVGILSASARVANQITPIRQASPAAVPISICSARLRFFCVSFCRLCLAAVLLFRFAVAALFPARATLPALRLFGCALEDAARLLPASFLAVGFLLRVALAEGFVRVALPWAVRTGVFSRTTRAEALASAFFFI